MKIKKESLSKQVFLIHGAGVGGVGIGEQIYNCLIDYGLSVDEAKNRIFIIDSKGLITSDRNVDFYKKKFVKDSEKFPWISDLDKEDTPSIIQQSGATVLIGTSGQEFCFRKEMVDAIKRNTSRPLLLPLFHRISTPDMFCQNMRQWMNDDVLVATSGPCVSTGYLLDTMKVGQCNNAFVSPGVGLGVLASGAREVLPEFFTAAAHAISDTLTQEELDRGILMPEIKKIRKVAEKVALTVAMSAVQKDVSRPCVYSDFQHNNDECRMKRLIEKIQWNPEYLPLVPM